MIGDAVRKIKVRKYNYNDFRDEIMNMGDTVLMR